jgi:hypothetical protein
MKLNVRVVIPNPINPSGAGFAGTQPVIDDSPACLPEASPSCSLIVANLFLLS